HSWHRLGIHIATIVGSQVTASRGCKVHFMLRPEGIASPAPTKAFTFELSPPKSPPRDVEYHYAGKSANSRDRTFTGKTKQHYGLQTKSQRVFRQPLLGISGGTPSQPTSARPPFPDETSAETDPPAPCARCGNPRAAGPPGHAPASPGRRPQSLPAAVLARPAVSRRPCPARTGVDPAARNPARVRDWPDTPRRSAAAWTD